MQEIYIFFAFLQENNDIVEKTTKKSIENKVVQSDENNCPFVDEYMQCADDSLSKDITDGDYDESSPKTVTKNDDDVFIFIILFLIYTILLLL